ncbi:MAG: hypothetical protein BWK79_04045 [Beggiatoa sp. IS2]|nr:MAG: hypothetical protein BWK79_04045 [Beggiatoa sp. IS2]
MPTLILAKKGININSVRKQLESIGEVIQAVPQMQASGKGVSFEFLVSTNQVKMKRFSVNGKQKD